MATTERTIAAPPDRVFETLADGWAYSNWVVGTAHIRHVDPGWPEPGSRIHFKDGRWPLLLHDYTRCVDWEPGAALVLKPRLWPLGELTAIITLEPVGANATRVRLQEEFTTGRLVALRNKLNELLLHGRNKEALRRLAGIVERRAAQRRRRSVAAPQDNRHPER